VGVPAGSKEVAAKRKPVGRSRNKRMYRSDPDGGPDAKYEGTTSSWIIPVSNMIFECRDPGILWIL
jgi:hypothetical protein